MYSAYFPAPLDTSASSLKQQQVIFSITSNTQVLLGNLNQFIKTSDVNFDCFWNYTLIQENLREDKIWQASLWALELAKLLSHRFVGFG